MINISKNGQWSLVGTELKKYREVEETLVKATRMHSQSEIHDLNKELTSKHPTSTSTEARNHSVGTIHPRDQREIKPEDNGVAKYTYLGERNVRLPKIRTDGRRTTSAGKSKAMWSDHPLQTKKREEQVGALMEEGNNPITRNLSKAGQANFAKLLKHTKNDPDRGSMVGGSTPNYNLSTGEEEPHNGQNASGSKETHTQDGVFSEIRLRHLWHHLSGKEGSTQEQHKDGSFTLHQGRHGEADSATSWHWDGKRLTSTQYDRNGNVNRTGSADLDATHKIENPPPKPRKVKVPDDPEKVEAAQNFNTKKKDLHKLLRNAKGDPVKQKEIKAQIDEHMSTKEKKLKKSLEEEDALMQAEIEADHLLEKSIDDRFLSKSLDSKDLELTDENIDKWIKNWK